jgi:tetratricopeptide (TPR) repeat protein
MYDAGRYLKLNGYWEASLQVLGRAIKWCESKPKEILETTGYWWLWANILYMAEKWEEAQAIFEVLHKKSPDAQELLGYFPHDIHR